MKTIDKMMTTEGIVQDYLFDTADWLENIKTIN